MQNLHDLFFEGVHLDFSLTDRHTFIQVLALTTDCLSDAKTYTFYIYNMFTAVDSLYQMREYFSKTHTYIFNTN